MTDIWLPRILAVGQILLLVCSAALIALGHNSIITDLFCAGSGGLLASSVISSSYKKITERMMLKRASDYTD